MDQEQGQMPAQEKSGQSATARRESGFWQQRHMLPAALAPNQMGWREERGSGPLCWEAWRTESPSCSAVKQTLHSCHFTVICMADQKDKFLSG